MHLTEMSMAGIVLALIGPAMMYEIFRRLPRTEEPSSSSEERFQQGLFNLAASIPANDAMRIGQPSQPAEPPRVHQEETVSSLSVR